MSEKEYCLAINFGKYSVSSTGTPRLKLPECIFSGISCLIWLWARCTGIEASPPLSFFITLQIVGPKLFIKPTRGKLHSQLINDGIGMKAINFTLSLVTLLISLRMVHIY